MTSTDTQHPPVENEEDNDESEEDKNLHVDDSSETDEDTVNVYLEVGKSALPYKHISKTMTVKDFKFVAEETFFDMPGNSTAPGPSARCIYRDKKGLEASDDKVVGDFANCRGVVVFKVSPPKRKEEYSIPSSNMILKKNSTKGEKTATPEKTEPGTNKNE